MSAPLRSGGRATLPNGATIVWSVAEGSRGRRWRESVTDEGGLVRSLLLEVTGGGRPARLELTSAAGLLTLHPATDQAEIHGNVVTPTGIRHLRNYQTQYPSLDLLNALFTLVLEHEGPAAAATLIKDELARNPTLIGLDRLLEAQLLTSPPERRHDLELVKGLVGQHIKRLGMYKCDNCGFRARQYYWRCPGCQKWETYSPKRTEMPDGYS